MRCRIHPVRELFQVKMIKVRRDSVVVLGSSSSRVFVVVPFIKTKHRVMEC